MGDGSLVGIREQGRCDRLSGPRCLLRLVRVLLMRVVDEVGVAFDAGLL